MTSFRLMLVVIFIFLLSVTNSGAWRRRSRRRSPAPRGPAHADETPPTFTYCPENVHDRYTVRTPTSVFWTNPEATDDSGTARLEIILGSISGSQFPEGNHTVIYVATDSSGNTANCTFSFRVVVIRCSVVPDAPSHGNYSRPCSTDFDSICHFECDPGYLINNYTQRCAIIPGTTDAFWEGVPPVCTSIDLDEPTTTRGPIHCDDASLNREDTASMCVTMTPLNPIDELANEEITADNVDEVAAVLANVTEIAATFEAHHVTTVSSIITDIIDAAPLSPEVSNNLMDVVDNVLDTATVVGPQPTSTDFLSTIESLTTAIHNSSSDNFTYAGENIVLAAVKVQRRDFPLSAQVADEYASSDVITFSANVDEEHGSGGAAYVSLPEAIIDFLPDGHEVIPVSVFGISSPELFHPDETFAPPTSTRQPNDMTDGDTRTVVASHILSVTIEGAVIENLPPSEAVLISFAVNQSLLKPGIETTPRCVFWDSESLGGAWSQEGCKTGAITHQGVVSCECNHLTSFSVLMDIKGGVQSIVLDVISMIGCIASLVCLVLTIGFLLGIRKLRQKHPQQILVNLSFALLGLYLVFVLGIDRTSPSDACVVSAILLHYFCLASITWMGVEAFSMYLMFIRVMNTYTPNLLLKCCLVGWGFPLGVVITSVAIDWTAYANPEYCFVVPGPSMYYALLLPIALILAVNVIVFIAVIYKLTCGRKTFSTWRTWEKKSDDRNGRLRAEITRRAQNAVAIGTLLGLTWVFGFLAVGDGEMFFSVLFAVFNSLQGVVIFLLFCVRQPDVKDSFRRLHSRSLSALRGSSDTNAKSNIYGQTATSNDSQGQPGQRTEFTTASAKTDSLTMDSKVTQK